MTAARRGVAWILGLCVLTVLVWSITLLGTRATFPLPLKHSLIASTAENLSAEMGRCPQGGDEDGILIARFDLAGYFWMFTYAPATQWFVFIQYPLTDHSQPLRAFIGQGADDAIVIQRVIEHPKEAVLGGPCTLLYPERA